MLGVGGAWAGGGRELGSNGDRFSIGEDGNVLEVDDGCPTM